MYIYICLPTGIWKIRQTEMPFYHYLLHFLTRILLILFHSVLSIIYSRFSNSFFKNWFGTLFNEYQMHIFELFFSLYIIHMFVHNIYIYMNAEDCNFFNWMQLVSMASTVIVSANLMMSMHIFSKCALIYVL